MRENYMKMLCHLNCIDCALLKYSWFVQAHVTTLHAFRIVFTVIFCCFVFHFVTCILWEMVFIETYLSRHLL